MKIAVIYELSEVDATKAPIQNISVFEMEYDTIPKKGDKFSPSDGQSIYCGRDISIYHVIYVRENDLSGFDAVVYARRLGNRVC